MMTTNRNPEARAALPVDPGDGVFRVERLGVAGAAPVTAQPAPSPPSRTDEDIVIDVELPPEADDAREPAAPSSVASHRSWFRRWIARAGAAEHAAEAAGRGGRP